MCLAHMVKQLEEGKISILPLRLAFSAHINQLMFTFSKQLVSVNIQQMPGFTITCINVCVCLCGQSDNVAHLSLSLCHLLYQYTVCPEHLSLSLLIQIILLHIIFDFSTLKKARVQTWGNVRHSNLHVCVCMSACHLHENAHILGGIVGFIQMSMPLSMLMLMSLVCLCVCLWGAGVIYEGADLWVRRYQMNSSLGC